MDAGFIGSGAVLAQQIFEHVGGNDGVALDLFDQVFAHDKAGKVLGYFCVEWVHGSGQSKSLVNDLRSV
jgi:hypothetical protein